MPEDEDYRLTPLQVPQFPTARSWSAQLRWCVAVIDPGSKDLGLAAGVLSYFLKHGFLSNKQAKIAQAVITRVRGAWADEDLAFQSFEAPAPAKSDSLSETLETMIPRGRA